MESRKVSWKSGARRCEVGRARKRRFFLLLMPTRSSVWHRLELGFGLSLVLHSFNHHIRYCSLVHAFLYLSFANGSKHPDPHGRPLHEVAWRVSHTLPNLKEFNT